MGENVTEETTPRKQNILAVRRLKASPAAIENSS